MTGLELIVHWEYHLGVSSCFDHHAATPSMHTAQTALVGEEDTFDGSTVKSIIRASSVLLACSCTCDLACRPSTYEWCMADMWACGASLPD